MPTTLVFTPLAFSNLPTALLKHLMTLIPIYFILVKCCGHEIEKNCPIMVWFHPGDFSSQDGSPLKFGPQLFMEYKEVVLVSINYR